MIWNEKDQQRIAPENLGFQSGTLTTPSGHQRPAVRRNLWTLYSSSSKERWSSNLIT